MSQVEVYALRIRRDLSSSERSALLEILPYNRRQRLLRTREDKQIQALCAYGALHLALHQQYDFFGFPPHRHCRGGQALFPGLSSHPVQPQSYRWRCGLCLEQCAGRDRPGAQPPAGRHRSPLLPLHGGTGLLGDVGPPGSHCKVPWPRLRCPGTLGCGAGV